MRPIVVMGVSGTGKSSVGAALARRLQVGFADGDDMHSAANIAKMAAGTPLNDEDRLPWLNAVGAWLAQHRDGGVIACSALKRSYRDILRRHCPQVTFLHLSGSPQLIAERLNRRSGHFMPAELLRSQFDILESLAPDEGGLVIDVDQDIDTIVEVYLQRRN